MAADRPPPARPRPGGTSRLKDVARHAGVSVGTVSNVLNRPDAVRPETREKVERAIAELGFVRNESARQLRAGTSRLLAYVVLDARNPFFTDVARGAQNRARRDDLMLVLCDSDSDPGREDDYLQLLLQQRVRGVLITAVDHKNPRLRELPALGVPVVLVDRVADESGLPSVGVDDVEGGRLAVAHLLAAGRERIAFVGPLDGLPQVVDRHAGARAALRAAGLPEDRLTLVQTKELSVDAGRKAARRLLRLPAESRPTAAFCANDLLALGLLRELTSAGVRVPDDVAIVGYDDIEFAAAASVPLTSVRQPRRDLGTLAVDLVLGVDEAADLHPVLQPRLVVRHSAP